MKKLFDVIESRINPQLIPAQDIFIDILDLKEKDPCFYEYLQKIEVDVNRENSFPFIIKEAQGREGGLILYDQTPVAIVEAEDMMQLVKEGGGEAHRHEIQTNYNSIGGNPHTYIALNTNGCQLLKGKLEILKQIRGVKDIGYGLPMLPEELIEDISKIRGIYLYPLYARNKELYTKDVSKENSMEDEILIAVLTFDKKSISKSTILNDITPGDRDELPDEILVNIKKLIKESYIFRKALHDYKIGILNLFHEKFISILKEKVNLSSYLTKEEIENWEMGDIEGMIKSGKFSKVQECVRRAMNFTKDFNLWSRITTLYNLYNTLLTLYIELPDPSWKYNPITADQQLKRMASLIYLIPVLRIQLLKSAPFLTEEIEIQVIENKTEEEVRDLNTKQIHISYVYPKAGEHWIKDAKEEVLKVSRNNLINQLNKIIDKFTVTSRAEAGRMFENAIISPLYKHYINFLKLKTISVNSELLSFNQNNLKHPINLFSYVEMPSIKLSEKTSLYGEAEDNKVGLRIEKAPICSNSPNL